MHPPWDRVASQGEKRQHYEAMRDEISRAKSSAGIAHKTARDFRHKAEEAKTEKKVAEKKLLHLTEKQKATEEQKKTGVWSGAGGGSIIILYQTWDIIGYPGGNRWKGWWEHEAVYGALMWAVTLLFAWFYKATRNE
jgi:hypothetical protein